MAIDDVEIPGTDAWWLKRLYEQLIVQRDYCQDMLDRYNGDSPLPMIAENQKDAVRWFVGQSRTNFERLIVNSVESRLRIRGLRTAVDDDEGGDAEAFTTWRRSRGRLWSHDAHKMALAMSRAYVIVGKDSQGNLLVTAEDPRMVTAITDPENPYRVLAAIKVFIDEVEGAERSYLYLPGRSPRVASRPIGSMPPTDARFRAQEFSWQDSLAAPEDFDPAAYVAQSAPWLAATGDLPALCPVVPFVNEDGLSEFDPFIPLLDRINQQILQRMTIATVQAFRQRAFKGLPQKDPKTGQDIDWDKIFVADPGAIWNIPASVEVWESGQVDLGPILMAIRDDVKDLAAVSGTPLYAITPDAANGSAEGASLQREQLNFKVESRQDRFAVSHEMVAELIFRTLGQNDRAQPGSIEIIWAPADRPSMSERAAAILQTNGVIPKYQQLTEIWGMDPAQADRAMTELKQDMIVAAQFAPKPAAPQAPTTPGRLPPERSGTQQQGQQAA